MSITFDQKKKRQKYLIVAFIVIILAAAGIWLVGSGTFSLPKKEMPVVQREIKINFGVFDNALLKELQPFEKIAPFDGQIGRDDPFISY